MTFARNAEGPFEVRDGDDAYRISRYDQMAPFLMSVVSDSDHWMYLSSRGGLTAGRVDEENSLFPYETDDRLHVAYGVTGPLTILRIHTDHKEVAIWRPFDPRQSDDRFERSLTKSVVGNWFEFEEIDHQLGLAFAYRWSTSDRFGFVRTATLRRGPTSQFRSAQVLDGFLNIMAAGVPLGSQQQSSTLVDAYKRSELDTETGIGVFTLEAQISDRAEAAESLRANVVWSRGLGDHRTLLDVEQIGRFLKEGTVEDERLSLGRRGAYLIAFDVQVEEVEKTRWDLVADVGLGHVQVAGLRALLLAGSDPDPLIQADIMTGTSNLIANIASADGLQQTGDRVAATHHAVNVLFNNMRGGVFDHNHVVQTKDFAGFVGVRNQRVYKAHQGFFTTLPDTIEIGSLLEVVATRDDAGLRRLTYEYLPIFFSRRHGDPSRPWNRFSIRVKNTDGSRRFDYQGNWRDIFQNWEALALSFPGFLEGIIAKFVNASTIDGHNPYRIARDGIEWETPEPENPWSNIGYWGDHQIVYLLRLLEACARYHPGAIARLLDQEIFSYAAVPYRIASYEEIVQDPKNTIVFDIALAKTIDQRVQTLGSDGKLLQNENGSVHHVTLAEKLLVPALAKLSNLVLDGGIWLNTQRPEWNDANNALVGNGLSLVTLSYLRRYLAWLARSLDGDNRTFSVSAEVVEWCHSVLGILRDHLPILDAPVTDSLRRRLLDQLGKAFSGYRAQVYHGGFSGRTELEAETMVELCMTATRYLDHSIVANRRDDGLYHSYNLIGLTPGGAGVEHLHEMLEGQVAVLSAGILTAEEALKLIDGLFAGRMYRADQQGFMLYPARTLPSFLEKNLIPPTRVDANPLLQALVAAGDTSIVERDAFGDYRFHPDCGTVPNLEAALTRLAEVPRWSHLVGTHRAETLETFEAVFRHHAFTGRSGSMYKYEGLGSIYWHMVAKLLVAIQEMFFEAVDQPAADGTIARLADAYYRVRGGLGFNKTPGEYGALPIDPYSHTPAGGGAQQPGMTGQVKEEIITRLGELGIRVSDGTVRFEPRLLQRSEFLTEATSWRFVDLDGGPRELTLPGGSLGFTFCGVPIVYRLTPAAPTISISDRSEQRTSVAGNQLDAIASRLLFERRGDISRIEVEIPESTLMPGSA